MKLDNEQIKSLLSRIRKNDLFALGELMEALTPKISKIAYAVLKDERLAEDVVDEVMIALVKNVHSFRSTQNIGGWINAVTVNRSIDYLRKTQKEFLPGDDFMAALPAATTEEKITERLQVAEALQKMDDLERRLLVDHSLNGETLPALAEKYGLTVKQVRLRLKRAHEHFIAFYDDGE